MGRVYGLVTGSAMLGSATDRLVLRRLPQLLWPDVKADNVKVVLRRRRTIIVSVSGVEMVGNGCGIRIRCELGDDVPSQAVSIDGGGSPQIQQHPESEAL
ncbi:hypothetical protein ACSBR2_039154 [Camellia fascicularis]